MSANPPGVAGSCITPIAACNLGSTGRRNVISVQVSSLQPQLGVLCHFSALLPGQRATQLFRQLDNCSRSGIADSFGAMPRERKSVI